MNLETSTLNVILAAILGAFGWILVHLSGISERVARIESRLASCKCGVTVPLAMLAVLTLSGCAGGPLFVREQQVERITHTLPAVTNTVQVVTNTVTVIQDRPVTNWLTNVVVEIIPPATFTTYATSTIVRVNPTVERTLEGAKQLNELNPTPSAPIVNLALGGLSAVLALVARAKTRQASVIPALIAGVEALNSTEAKAAVRRRAEDAGVQPILHELVQRHT